MEDRQQRPNIRRPIRQEYPEVRVNAVRSSLVRAAKLPHIEVELQGSKINALFDTGAAVSYLPISSVPTDIETGHQPTAKAANGSSLQFLGTCKAILRIGEIFVPHTFLVSSDLECPAPLLIGSDIIEKINKNGHDVNFNLLSALFNDQGEDSKESAHEGEDSQESVQRRRRLERVKEKTLKRVQVEKIRKDSES
uniref:RVP domain-containing protein n=1 Tax=Caenorhabditis japonica TaxID=281687 RepID=A0A8R1EGD9_CAEJA